MQDKQGRARRVHGVPDPGRISGGRGNVALSSRLLAEANDLHGIGPSDPGASSWNEVSFERARVLSQKMAAVTAP